MELNELLTDENLAAKGKWLKFGTDAELLIASSNSPKYKSAIRRHTANQPKHKLRTDGKLQDKIVAEAIADAILLDFRGITKDGQPLQNTRENRLLLLTSAPVLEFVANEMENLANFQEEAAQEEAETLGKQPSGGSDTVTPES